MPFSGNPLDRASNFREDDAWVAERLIAPDSRFLLLSRLEVLTRQSEQAELVWLDSGVRGALGEETPVVLLGIRDGVAHFAVDTTDLPHAQSLVGGEGVAFAEPRGLAATLPAGEAGIVAQARALVDWHARHRFCGTCGGPTRPIKAGGARQCTACGAQFFPRIDPSVIMAVWRGDRCLLGRRRGRPPGNFSCVAGYIEQGETIEEAVAREVFEEVGLRVDQVTYQASQPWPFPSTLMIGCFAHATSEEARVDELEIEEARWFTRDELRAAVAGQDTGLVLPAPVAISHHLIRMWAESETAQ